MDVAKDCRLQDSATLFWLRDILSSRDDCGRFLYVQLAEASMVRDPRSGSEDPGIDDVVGALHDEDCRRIVESLDEPLTASELRERCEIPRSTLYRKLDRLREATLVRERPEFRSDGSHASQYAVDFRSVVIRREETAELNVEIERPATRSDERLAELWTEIGREL